MIASSTRALNRVLVVSGLGLVALTGCSQQGDAAEAAQQYVTGTYQSQCEMTHPSRGEAAKDCQDADTETVWPGHPTEVTETVKWGDGYAVTIPDEDGTKDVFGMLDHDGEWKVAEFDIIDAEDELTDNPACAALNQDGQETC